MPMWAVSAYHYRRRCRHRRQLRVALPVSLTAIPDGKPLELFQHVPWPQSDLDRSPLPCAPFPREAPSPCLQIPAAHPPALHRCSCVVTARCHGRTQRPLPLPAAILYFLPSPLRRTRLSVTCFIPAFLSLATLLLWIAQGSEEQFASALVVRFVVSVYAYAPSPLPHTHVYV
ncbi:hypothetical protein AAHC03_024276 [Spirometra sp. Aus1]